MTALTVATLDAVRFDARGLVPAIVQSADGGDVRMLGYGAAVRLAYPNTPLTVSFDGITPPPAARGPVYRYRWTGATIEPVP